MLASHCWNCHELSDLKQTDLSFSSGSQKFCQGIGRAASLKENLDSTRDSTRESNCLFQLPGAACISWLIVVFFIFKVSSEAFPNLSVSEL